MSLEHKILQHGTTQLLALSGRVDSASAAQLEGALQPLFTQPAQQAVLDLSGLDYISSAGLRVILMAAKQARASQGRLLLCGLLPQVREVFAVSGFLKILSVVPTLHEALGELSAPPAQA